MAAHYLAFYCGDDMVNLPWLSVGAAGFVSVVGHVVGDRLHEMIDAYRAGDVAGALRIHRELLPVYTGHVQDPGSDHDQGGARPARPARRTGPAAAGRMRRDAEVDRLRDDLAAGGVKLK